MGVERVLVIRTSVPIFSFWLDDGDRVMIRSHFSLLEVEPANSFRNERLILGKIIERLGFVLSWHLWGVHDLLLLVFWSFSFALLNIVSIGLN